jgi:purine-binding chemotaxis protein CheW
MKMMNHLLIFNIDGNGYAICLQAVERVVPAVEITPLPDGPHIVTGVINVRGQVIPILNIRRKFRLHERAMDLDDIIVIVKGSKWTIAFAVDSVQGVIERRKEEITPAESILPDMAYTEGMIKIHGDIVFLHDIDRALSFEEMDKFEAVMAKRLVRRRPLETL